MKKQWIRCKRCDFDIPRKEVYKLLGSFHICWGKKDKKALKEFIEKNLYDL